MTKPMPTSLEIRQTTASTPLSRQQKQFNQLIKKIEQQKHLLLEWQQAVQEYNQILAKEIIPLQDELQEQKTALIYLFDAAYPNKLFKKTDKQKLSHLIREISAHLILDYGREDLKSLHDKYSDTVFDQIQEEAEQFENELFKQMSEQMFGGDLGDDVDWSSPESIEKAFQQQFQQEQAAAEQKANAKKNARQIKAAAKKQQEEQNVSLSIREVFRKLTSALHPDREQDPDERLRKTEMMQRVNIAYQKKDLLGLLALQLEIEQIDAEHINNIAEDKLKYFVKLLKDQLSELEYEVDNMVDPFKMRLNMSPRAKLTPKELFMHLRMDIMHMKSDIKSAKNNVQILQDLTTLKYWLKTYRIPKPESYDDLFGY